MDSFENIKQHCKANSRFTPIIDDFLIYYAAHNDRLERKMDQKLKQYKHVTKKVESKYVNFLKSEYLASQIFRKDGLLGKYLHHAAIKALPAEQYAFLLAQHKHPWRFSFAQIIDRPAEDFFQMLDVFTGEEYLLYSPGMSRTLDDELVHLWFNLIAFNGKCWQTYGLLIGFNGFTANDIFFFGTELYPQLEDEKDLLRAVEKNPWPFFMLLSRANIPFNKSQGELLIYHTALDEMPSFPYGLLKDIFEIRWKDGVYELRGGKCSEPPHFAKAYYIEEDNTLLRFAFSKSGFTELTCLLQQQGIKLHPEPEVEVTPGMLITAEEILRRKIELNPYEERFVDEEETESEELGKLNHLIKLLLPLVNNKEPVDIEKLAGESDVDVEVAKILLKNMEEQIRKFGERK